MSQSAPGAWPPFPEKSTDDFLFFFILLRIEGRCYDLKCIYKIESKRVIIIKNLHYQSYKHGYLKFMGNSWLNKLGLFMITYSELPKVSKKIWNSSLHRSRNCQGVLLLILLFSGLLLFVLDRLQYISGLVTLENLVNLLNLVALIILA